MTNCDCADPGDQILDVNALCVILQDQYVGGSGIETPPQKVYVRKLNVQQAFDVRQSPTPTMPENGEAPEKDSDSIVG